MREEHRGEDAVPAAKLKGNLSLGGGGSRDDKLQKRLDELQRKFDTLVNGCTPSGGGPASGTVTAKDPPKDPKRPPMGSQG